MYRVNLIGRSSAGLGVDAGILTQTLRGSEFSTAVIVTDRGRGLRLADRALARLNRLRKRHRVTINVFLEDIVERWLELADINVLIPNQEWTRPSTIDLLRQLDAVFCKSQYATEIFSRVASSIFIGFTTRDRRRSDLTVQDFSRYLHVAGKSSQKGTAMLVRVWSAHPEWPVLNVVTRIPLWAYRAPNIKVQSYVAESALLTLQNGCGVHLCPSEAEGFGHVLCEGMSCGALVLTTDAPPMNELVRPGFGVLVPYAGRKPQSLGMNHYVDERSLERAVIEVLQMPVADKQTMGRSARQLFEKGVQEFEERLKSALRSLLTARS